MGVESARARGTAESKEGIAPLEVGALFLERYTVCGLEEHGPDRNVYWLGAARPCPVCGVENDGGADVCGFCGSALPPAPPLRLIEQRLNEPPRALPPSSFIAGGCLYSLLAVDAPWTPLLTGPAHGVLTDVGMRRGGRGEPNEDAVFALSVMAQTSAGSAACGIYLVADGVGGAAVGQVASRLTIETVGRALQDKALTPLLGGNAPGTEQARNALSAAIRMANERLMAYAQAQQLVLGTTVAAAVVVGAQLVWANVGDSRIYLERGGELKPLTRDDSYVAGLVANGALAPDEIYAHPQRNVILKSLGDPSGFEFEVYPQEGGALTVESGDRLLLCTDGLWETVRDPEVARVLRETADAQLACAQLVSRANAAGGADNISVIVVNF